MRYDYTSGVDANIPGTFLADDSAGSVGRTGKITSLGTLYIVQLDRPEPDVNEVTRGPIPIAPDEFRYRKCRRCSQSTNEHCLQGTA